MSFGDERDRRGASGPGAPSAPAAPSASAPSAADPTPAAGAVTALLARIARGDADAAPLLAPGMRAGRYEVIRTIGRGGFGAVYEAHDTALHRLVALKVLRPGPAAGPDAAIPSEGEAAARLAHPNIAAIHDAGTLDGGAPYLVYELLHGETLESRLARGPLPPRDAWRIAAAVARALDHAHRAGVVHRDLKPSNVFLVADGNVKVLDFGIALLLGRRAIAAGTPAYMAPEQRRDGPEDARTDLYALGLLLREMLTGVAPRARPGAGGATGAGAGASGSTGAGAGASTGPGPDAAASAGAATTGTPPVPARGTGAAAQDVVRPVPRAAQAILAALLAEDPAARPRSARDALEAIEAAARGSAAPRGRALLTAAGVAVAIVALVAAGLAVRARRATADRAAGGAGAAAVAAPSPSIAVLPFANLSGDAAQEHFSDGLSEEVRNALARVEGLRVVGRTSSFSFKGKEATVADVARALGVAAVLEGSVRREGNRVRVTARLVNAADGFHVWSERYDRELTGIFEVQEEIATAVVRALAPRLLPGGGATATAAAGDSTRSPEAYDQFLLGRKHHYDGTDSGLSRAIPAYERAVALDPSYARAWAWLAMALSVEHGNDAAEIARGKQRSLEAAERAVALAPGLPDGWLARGRLRMDVRHDLPGARADLERAAALNPRDAETQRGLALVLGRDGDLPGALEAARRATELEPLAATYWTTLAYLALGARDTALVRRAANRALALAPGHAYARSHLVVSHVLDGDGRAALAAAQGIVSSEPFRLFSLALAHHALGNAAESDRALDALAARASGGYRYQVAQVHAWRGDRDRAFAWLDAAYEALDTGIVSMPHDPLVAGLRDDPRYAALLAKVGLRAR